MFEKVCPLSFRNLLIHWWLYYTTMCRNFNYLIQDSFEYNYFKLESSDKLLHLENDSEWTLVDNFITEYDNKTRC